jgi:hypothetical protein
MEAQRLTVGKLVLRVLLYGATFLSAYLLYDAVVSDDAPPAQWIGSIFVLVVMVPFIVMAWRVRLMSPETREAHVARIEARRAEMATRSTVDVRRAARAGAKREILRSGVDATGASSPSGTVRPPAPSRHSWASPWR